MTAAALFRRSPALDSAAGSDRDLLRRFADGRDDTAFATLVHRYGRLVFATCLRVLGHRADAEDAYQASFLVLARRAGSVRSDEKLAGWLHTVAVRTATEVRRMRARAHAAPSLTLPVPKESPRDAAEQSELAAMLDEELAKLPDHYRLAVVLCELNGVGRKAAAKELGIAEGTLSSRLAKARKMLAERLARRGFVGVSAGAITAALGSAAAAKIPATVLALEHAISIINITTQSVADTVVKAMCATKLKSGAMLAVLMAALGGVVWTTAVGAGPGDGPAPAKAKDEKPDPAGALVKQLGSKEFAEREAAAKMLREMGAKALLAVQAGLKSDSPEVAQRCRRIAGAIRKDAREAFAAEFLADKERTKPFDYPIWKRYVEMVGDSQASRAVFAELLKYKYPDGLEVLDAADRDPAKADGLYRTHLSDLARQVEPLMKYTFSIAELMPVHTADIAAYTLLLGSYRTDATPPEKLRGEESSRYINGRNYVLQFGEGLQNGLAGKLVVQGKDTKVGKLGRVAEAGPPGTDKVFARLYAHFLAADPTPERWRESPDPFDIDFDGNSPRTPFPDTLRVEALPVARRAVADKSATPLQRARWIPILRRFGDAMDATRLAGLFADKTPLPLRGQGLGFAGLPVQVREWAVGTALVLRGKNPADFGFDRFKKEMPKRELVEQYWRTDWFAAQEPDPLATGFVPADAKDKVLKTAIEWLDEEAKKDKEPKKDDPAALVGQLGSKDFAEREAAQKKLKELGAAAFAAVTAGLKSDNPEVVRRCQKLLPDLRAAWLARPESDLWKRFAAITGDTPHAKELFVEMASDPERAASLVAENPAKEYAAVVETAVRTIRAKYDERERESRRTGIDRLGRLRLLGGGRGEATLLFFLGSSPETADTAPQIGPDNRWLWHNYLREAFISGKPNGREFPPEVRRLFAAWLGGRADQADVPAGMAFASFHKFAGVLPVARAMLGNDRLTTVERTPALYALALVGTEDDLRRVVPFLDSDAVWLSTKYTHTDGRSYPLTVQVRDVAHAAVGKLLGADLADLGFEFCKKGEPDDGLTFRYDHFAGFTTDAKRAASHDKVRVLLKNAPVPKDFGPPRPKKLPRVAPPPAELRKDLAGPSVLCTAEMVGRIEARAAELVKKFPAAEDRARIALHAAQAIANGRLREDHARVEKFADEALDLSRDPVTRWKARSLIASTICIGDKDLAEKRRLQAEVLLAGYAELLAQDLPDAVPEVPRMRKLRLPPDGPDSDPAERARVLAERDAQDAAIAEAEFVKEQVFGRTVLLTQLRDLFKPDGADELRKLAAARMAAGEVKTLLARVLDGK